jgi:hypothetical protein
MAENGRVKIRIMFTQNINRTDHVETYEEDATFFKLYYQFIKHAFGLKYCRQDQQNATHISIFLDDAPDTAEKLDNFKNYLSSLSFLPDFFQAGVVIDKQDIAEVDSKQHIILQAVDVLLGAIQFKLNDHNRVIPPAKRRGNRTKAKHRVYRFINTRLRQMRPGFNVGGTTGHPDGEKSRWLMPYRHWCFRPYQSVQDRTYGKKKKKRKK